MDTKLLIWRPYPGNSVPVDWPLFVGKKAVSSLTLGLTNIAIAFITGTASKREIQTVFLLQSGRTWAVTVEVHCLNCNIFLIR